MRLRVGVQMRAALLLVISSATILAGAACDAGGGEDGVAGTGTAASAQWLATRTSGSIAAQGCVPARPHEPGTHDRTIISGGVERQYTLHVPPSYTGEEAVPVVLNIHGLGSNAGQQAAFSGLPGKSDEAGFVLVMPQARGEPALWSAFKANSADVLFVSLLLDDLERRLCVDSDRVYSTGLSMGAMISARLACDLSGRIAAIAPVAGFAMPRDCSSERAVSIVAFHGTDDPILPFDGGPVGLPGIDFTVRSVGEAMADWAVHDGCIGGPKVELVTEHVRRLTFDGCDGGATVELYVVEGGGHTWPDGTLEAEFVSATTREISANDLMWDFFQAHPMP